MVEGKKFMWDGRVCESREAADSAKSGYAADGFETHVSEEQGKLLVYTRRVAKQVIVEQSV